MGVAPLSWMYSSTTVPALGCVGVKAREQAMSQGVHRAYDETDPLTIVQSSWKFLEVLGISAAQSPGYATDVRTLQIHFLNKNKGFCNPGAVIHSFIFVVSGKCVFLGCSTPSGHMKRIPRLLIQKLPALDSSCSPCQINP